MERETFCFLGGVKFFCRGFGGFGLLITVKKPYLGEPLSIFFSEKGNNPANDSLIKFQK